MDNGYLSNDLGTRVLKADTTKADAKKLLEEEILPLVRSSKARTEELWVMLEKAESAIDGASQKSAAHPHPRDGMSFRENIASVKEWNRNAPSDLQIRGTYDELGAFHSAWQTWNEAHEERNSLTGVAFEYGRHGVDVLKMLGSGGEGYTYRSL